MDNLQFHFEQYKMLRQEILFSMQEMYRTEWFTILTVAAIYACFLFRKRDISIRAIWFAPSCLILLSGVHSIMLSLRIRTIAAYLKLIENAAFGSGVVLPGWERYKSTCAWVDITDSLLAISAWVFALVGTLVLSYWLCCRQKENS